MRGGHNRIDLTGKRFGRLVVESYGETRGKIAYWKCRCDCGSTKLISSGSLRTGDSNSCGCLKREQTVDRNTKHSLDQRGKRNRFYKVWLAMKNRCLNQKCKDYQNYGGKGITVCDEWINNPAAFVKWCEEQPKPEKRALLDRRDGTKGYSPENCRFLSDAESVRNRSMSIFVEINGERLVLKDAVKKYGVVSYGCAKIRVREYGWKPIDSVLIKSHLNRSIK